MISARQSFNDDIETILDRIARDLVKHPSQVHSCCKKGYLGTVIEVDDIHKLPNVIESCRAALMMVYTTLCPYCHAFNTVFERVAKEYTGKAVFLRINADRFPEIAYELNIMSTPTTVVFVDGRIADYVVGYIPYSMFRSYVERLLARIGCIEAG